MDATLEHCPAKGSRLAGADAAGHGLSNRVPDVPAGGAAFGTSGSPLGGRRTGRGGPVRRGGNRRIVLGATMDPTVRPSGPERAGSGGR